MGKPWGMGELGARTMGSGRRAGDGWMSCGWEAMGTGKPGGRCRGSELATGRKGKWWGRYKGLSEQGGSCKGSGRATGGLTREVLRGRGRSPNIFGAPESLQNDPGSPKLGGGGVGWGDSVQTKFNLLQISPNTNQAKFLQLA